MPFLSRQQAKWAFTPSGQKALGGMDKVKEWAVATNFEKLPDRKNKLMGGAVRRFSLDTKKDKLDD